MHSSSEVLSLPIVIQTTGAFVSQAQTIRLSVETWAQATFSKCFFLNSLVTLTVKVEDISAKARNSPTMSSIESAHLKRLCKQVQVGIATLYTQVVQNAQIKNLADEIFFLDHLRELERTWSNETPLHAHYTQAHNPVTPEQVEALDNTGFIQALEEHSDTFASHPVSCFVSYANADGSAFASMVCRHLKAAGITAKTQEDLGPRIGLDRGIVDREIQDADYVIVLGSKAYGEQDASPSIMDKPSERILRALVGGTVLRSFPPGMNHSRTGYADFRQVTDYHSQALELLERLYARENKSFPLFKGPPVAKTDPIQTSLRAAYAERSKIRRFMGTAAPLESVYVAPDICSTLLSATQQRVWVVGEPGSGKSTLCHYIAYLYGTSQGEKLGEWATNCSGIIWIPLRELLLYDKNGISLEKLVAKLWFKGKILDGLKAWLQSSNLIFLLDSEEEVAHLCEERNPREELLNDLLNRPRSIITSRTDQRCPEGPEEVKRVKIPPLDQAAIEAFAAKFFADAQMAGEAPLFLSSVTHSMQELMQVPFTLELLCYRWSKSKSLSIAPIHLYQDILADLCRLKAERAGRDLHDYSSTNVEAEFPALPYLFEMAFRLMKQGKGAVLSPEIYDPILNKIEKGEQKTQITDQLFSDEAFLHRVNRPGRLSNQCYVFHHTSFMGYCAARHIAPQLLANGGNLFALMEGSTPSQITNSWLNLASLASALHAALDPMTSPLHRAVASNDLEKTKDLLKEGTPINQADKKGNTLLVIAILCGLVEMVEFLLEKRADVNQGLGGGDTPLHLAIGLGHVEIVKLLIDNGAAVNQAGCERTSLTLATGSGQFETANFLLERGANINRSDTNGMTPLHLAAALGHTEMVNFLIEKGATIDRANKIGRRALNMVSIIGNVEMAKLLLEKGADINRSDRNGMTPLHLAALLGRAKMVFFLIEKGAAINPTNRHGETPLLLVSSSGTMEIVKLLLENEADTNQSDDDGATPLLLAIFEAHVEVAKLLIKKGANTNQPDEDGTTPLHLAARLGRVEELKFLLENGADINQKARNGPRVENELALLHAAATSGHVGVVKLLIKKGAAINQTNESGLTSLHVAAGLGHTAVVRFFLKAGARVDLALVDGRTALSFARDGGLEEIVRLLTEHTRQELSLNEKYEEVGRLFAEHTEQGAG